MTSPNNDGWVTEEGQDAAEWTYESEGPKCPYCGRQSTADEPHYYSQQDYTEETCDRCGRTFDVDVETATYWTCSPRAESPAPEGDVQ